MKSFMEGKKTATGLSIGAFTPMLTSLLVMFGVTSEDAATIVNVAGGVIGGILTLYGIIDRHARTHKK